MFTTAAPCTPSLPPPAAEAAPPAAPHRARSPAPGIEPAPAPPLRAKGDAYGVGSIYPGMTKSHPTPFRSRLRKGMRVRHGLIEVGVLQARQFPKYLLMHPVQHGPDFDGSGVLGRVRVRDGIGAKEAQKVRRE